MTSRLLLPEVPSVFPVSVTQKGPPLVPGRPGARGLLSPRLLPLGWGTAPTGSPGRSRPSSSPSLDRGFLGRREKGAEQEGLVPRCWLCAVCWSARSLCVGPSISGFRAWLSTCGPDLGTPLKKERGEGSLEDFRSKLLRGPSLQHFLQSAAPPGQDAVHACQLMSWKTLPLTLDPPAWQVPRRK
ncbi:hypothetical protein E2320_023028, partial [Naja naja]